ncbi:MAG TPA: hypothetical protein VH518_12695 [Tepidisphaeraceae bacterium]|jgi:hypothetical protein
MPSKICLKSVTLALWATASFALTVAILHPQSLQAVPPPLADGVMLNVSTLTLEGVELSLLYDNKPAPTEPISLPSGSTLPVTLLARSVSPESKGEVHAKVTIFATTPVSKMSRVLPTAKELWSSEQTIVLSPGQSEQKIALKPGVTLPAGSAVFVTITSGKNSIRPLNVAVAPDPTATASKGS